MAVTSSVQNAIRSAFALCSVITRRFSFRKWATEDSRIIAYMPLRSLARVSSAE